jgi:PleD family two-component response regulator
MKQFTPVTSSPSSPSSPSSLSPAALSRPTPSPAPPRPSSGGAWNILLVEDNMVNQEVGRAMLERIGCAVTVAGDGLKALAALEVGSFDLILMDCQMPELDG